MRADDLRASLLGAPTPRRRIDRNVLFGFAAGVALGLALVPWAVGAAPPGAAQVGHVPTVPLLAAPPMAFAAPALIARRKAD